MSKRRWRSELRRMLDELGGGTVDDTGGGHFKLQLSVGGMPVFVASTPSDHRNIQNVRALLRRAAKQLGIRK